MDISTTVSTPLNRPVLIRSGDKPNVSQASSAPEITPINQDTATIRQQAVTADPVESFLALGRQAEEERRPLTAREILSEESNDQTEQNLRQDTEILNTPTDDISEQVRAIDSPEIQDNPEETLKIAEEIQREAQFLEGLTAQEQAALDEARRLAIQSRFEMAQERREEAKEEREEKLAEERAEAARNRRANTPNPFREITTPFDIIEEETPIVNLGTSINVIA